MIAALALAAALSVYDGDTFTLPSGEKIRIENIDAPEIGPRSRCTAESYLAVHAKHRLQKLLSEGRPEIFRTGRKHRERSIARVQVNGQDVGKVLVAELLAVDWDGQTHDWCRYWPKR